MIVRIQIILFLIYLTVTSCEPTVSFDEPQPVNTNNLANFPKRLQGKYLSLQDSSELLIKDKFIIKNYYDSDKRLTSEVDSNFIIKGDSVLNVIMNKMGKITRDGDSVLIQYHFTDTLFEIDEDGVLRKFRGHYFLSTQYTHGNWTVEKVDFSKGHLSIGQIATKEEINSLNEITENPVDTIIPDKYTLSKDQFREFIKRNGFSKSVNYIRIK
jgi:hypothetical protein